MDDSIAIVGGGLAGTCLAGLLAAQGWQVQLFEAQRLADAPPAARDLRTLALARSSWDTLAGLGIGRDALEAAPIRQVHVSFRGRPGRVLLDAAESARDALGHTVNYGRLLQALRTAALARPEIRIHEGCTVRDVGGSSSAARLRWVDGDGRRQERLAPLVVVADGGALSEQGPALAWRYRQHALACRVETDRRADGTAWERFTVDGPIALLPAGEGHALIWTGPAARIQRLQAADDPAFLAELQDWFGDRAGRFVRCSARMSYPLGARFQLHPARRRVVRIANAAQSLHPVAGQGFNLGLRDVAALASLLSETAAQSPRGDPGAAGLLARYGRVRAPDRRWASGLTHLMAELFALPIPGLALGSAAAFGLLDGSLGLRQRFARVMADGAGT